MAGPDSAIVLQFESDYDLLFQQQISRLRQYVRVKPGCTGSMTSFGLLGPSTPQNITGVRHGLTQWHDSPSYRRWASKEDYSDPQILDEEDQLEVLVDLEMGYAQNGAGGVARQMDKTLIDQATATAKSGAKGTDTVAFDATAPNSDGSGGNQIAAGGAGLTVDKMRMARGIFDAREVGVDEMDAGVRNFVWVTNGAGHKQLLEQTEATNEDYIGIVILNGQEQSMRMPLVAGRITEFMGFKIKISNQLNLSGTDFLNLCWHQKAMGLALWGGRTIWVGQLPEHNLARGIMVKEHFGASRIQDKGVLAVACNP